MLKEKKYCNECRWYKPYLNQTTTYPKSKRESHVRKGLMIETYCDSRIDNKNHDCKYYEKRIPFMKRLFGAKYVTDKKD